MIDDDDDDFSLVDEPDEEAAGERTNTLAVGARPPTPQMLNALEAQFRRDGLPPVMFIETDDDGREIFGNALEFAKLMNMPADISPTMDQADAWIASRRWPSWTW